MQRFKPSARGISVLLADILIVAGAFALSFLIRFDFNLSDPFMAALLPNLPGVLACYVSCFYFFSLYHGIFYFSSFSDLLNITKACALAGVLAAAFTMFVQQGRFPRSILLLHPILVFVGIGGVRFSIRLGKTLLDMPRVFARDARSVLLIGAGELGESVLRQMHKAMDVRYRVVGFLDDNKAKWGMHIHGVPVFGGRATLLAVLKKRQIDEIVIAVASRRGELVRSIIEDLRGLQEKPELKIAPSLGEMLSAPSAGFSPRKVRPADLLTRGVVKLDMARIGRFLAGKTILVTGAGGTIGAELCRQALQFKPGKIVLLENHATSLFYSDMELTKSSGSCQIVPVLGDIRDQALIDRVFRQHKPQVVLHAAAHKHVHQLEANVAEGIGNNVLGTYYLSSAAKKHEAEAFLLVSTDKAVRPTSVMGATKRAAELIVRWMASQKSGTRFVAVRFGNVLGSSGSVLEIFQQQIARGGPLTLTHPEVTRYFMTVEESVQLILQAAAMARGGEIFVLKMGTPVKIMEMAKNLILLSGLEPGKDIEIEVTGLKQGEKLEEELIDDPRQCDDSEHSSIMVLRDDSLSDVESPVLDLEILSRTAGTETLVAKLREIVPAFEPAEAHNASTLQPRV